VKRNWDLKLKQIEPMYVHSNKIKKKKSFDLLICPRDMVRVRGIMLYGNGIICFIGQILDLIF
jgi:hypothetical protein